MDKDIILKQYFGYKKLNKDQKKIIQAILSGRDTLGIMPTGSGKSLCFQIPALMFNGTTLVISPLISLMKNQVTFLLKRGIKAAYISSSLTTEQIQIIYEKAQSQKYKLIYIAPERLNTDEFISLSKTLPISMIVVDEAHCISKWGKNFRPSYLTITSFINSLTYRPIVSAFTATATPFVQEEIIKFLGLNDPYCKVTGFDRPNLYFDVKFPKNKLSKLLKLIRNFKNKNGIIYCSTRTTVDMLYQFLKEKGFPVTSYHAGLNEYIREKNQNDFQDNRKNIMIATNAFGLGIDKLNINFIIHYNMPVSLDDYYQQVGRAGRNGMPAYCILLFSEKDIEISKHIIEYNLKNILLQKENYNINIQNYKDLKIMVNYCLTNKCFRSYILNYFGQKHKKNCCYCGNCKRAHNILDITIYTKIIFSCILRLKAQLGYASKTMTIQILQGCTDKYILKLGLNHLSTYASMDYFPTSYIKTFIDFLKSEGLLYENNNSRLELSNTSIDILKGEKKIYIPLLLMNNFPL